LGSGVGFISSPVSFLLTGCVVIYIGYVSSINERNEKMPRYLVTISAQIEVEANDETEAEITAAECFDFGSANFEIELDENT